MQHHDFAQVILLLPRPREDSNSVRGRCVAIREKIPTHNREVCAITLGRPPSYVRIHMLQSLFVAGQCLESSGERKVIVELLRDIEKGLGWETEYRVQSYWRSGVGEDAPV